MIKENLEKIKKQLENGNNLGEKVTLVGATKFVCNEDIRLAIENGLYDIAENKAQEFRDKYPYFKDVNYHFIGTLQSNKIKYLINKAYLIQSVSSMELIEEISSFSQKENVETNILIQINIGLEENKHGFNLENANEIVEIASKKPNLKVLGLMAMLPYTNDEQILIPLMDKMREKYDELKDEYNFKYLSMGMSEDYLLAIQHGSNMVRIGTKIFGKRY